MKLKDRVAIVTGAGGGIGKGIAEVFALEEGAKVIVAERNVDNGKAVAAEISAAGGDATFCPTTQVCHEKP